MKRTITYCEAINEALTQAMEQDDSVFVYGIGVDDHKSIFGTTAGLQERFGKDRVIDTPLAEDSMTGVGIGAALNGMRPVHIHIRVDFMLLAYNQIVNMLSSMQYGSNNQLNAPIVIRAIIGRGWGQGFQHSKSMFSSFCHVPGLTIIAPTSPYDVKGMLISAIKSDNPVICFEHRWLYWQKGEVPKKSYVVPLFGSTVVRKGTDITIVATSWMVIEALQVADILKEKCKIKVEVIDVRSLSDFDIETIYKSVKKTVCCIFADNDWIFCGMSAEILSSLYECYQSNRSIFRFSKSGYRIPYLQNMPLIKRIGFKHTPCPTARRLENEFYPNAKTIIKECEKLLHLNCIPLKDIDFYSHEHKFKGPF